MHDDEIGAVVESIQNVVGWEWDPETDTAIVYVSEKVDEGDLPEDHIIANALEDLGVETDVVPVGSAFRAEVVYERWDPDAAMMPLGVPEARHRPVVDGVSEINAKTTAATAGYYKASVVREDRFDAAKIRAGDLVRLSNNHVYARSDQAVFGEPIIQPSPMDGGDVDEDVVGEFVGKVPLEDGVRVDIAARSIDQDQDDVAKHDLADSYGTSIERSTPDRGARLVKTGRTTGVTTGRVIGRSVSAPVRYPNGQVRLTDCLLATGMSQPGDSGSDVFLEDSGAYVGALFAGSSSATLICKAANIEDDLGVELVPRSGGTPGPSPPGGAWWKRLLRWLFG